MAAALVSRLALAARSAKLPTAQLTSLPTEAIKRGLLASVSADGIRSMFCGAVSSASGAQSIFIGVVDPAVVG